MLSLPSVLSLVLSFTDWDWSPFTLPERLGWPYTYTLCSPTGRIYTVSSDPEDASVECLAVRGDRVLRTGSFSELKPSYWAEKIGWHVVHQLDNDFVVVPGLTDAHAHVLGNGFARSLDLSGSQSVEEVVNRVKTYILAHPDVEHDRSRWIQGMGWDQTKWPGSQFPTADDLAQDPLLQDRPIALQRIDGHALWLSSTALQITNSSLPEGLPDAVDGGLIVRDFAGHPTGVFVDNAMGLVPVPPWNEQQMQEYFDTTVEEALSVGLTSIHDAAVAPHMVEFFKRQADAGNLPIRLYLMASTSNLTSLPTKLVHYGKDQRLTLRAAKLFSDGALGSWGAALLEPYTDRPETQGIMRMGEAELEHVIRTWARAGWQVNTHCIGDRANHIVLAILERVIRSENISVEEWRPRIEHAMVMIPEDVERIGRLGVIASVQPTHATSDMGFAEARLGPERIRTAFAYRSLLEASPTGILPLGSDFPVERVNPLRGFFAAVARLSPETGTSPHGPGGWYPKQKLTRAQALRGMTLAPAYASFEEKELGSLDPGKKADFVVFDRDFMSADQSEIMGSRVRCVVVDGSVVWRAKEGKTCVF